MQVGFATTEDGGIPFWHRSFAGNAAEVSQVADVIERLQRCVHHRSFTLIDDSKLLSQVNTHLKQLNYSLQQKKAKGHSLYFYFAIYRKGTQTFRYQRINDALRDVGLDALTLPCP